MSMLIRLYPRAWRDRYEAEVRDLIACHQSRYDRLGIKRSGTIYGPADRSMDRFAIEVDDAGVLTVDTTHVALGPLPIVLGQPGLIPPRVPHGCAG